ncbi:MAG: vanadium-dependent haloperoxidase [Saprospiraceae bacterium]|nr:vanadium-dependent haloperoxidase [Saprospiraceae bacterium]
MKNFIRFSYILGLFTLVFVITYCKPDNDEKINLQGDVADSEAATKWADMTLRAVYRLAGNTPTYCSRALGYLGLTMYESVVQGSATHQSVFKQLNNATTLPQIESNKGYNWVLALNAGQSLMLKKLYAFSATTKASIDSLEAALEKQHSATETADVIERSKKFGQNVAEAIFLWSTVDGGFEGYLRNFPTDYVVPTGPGKWLPPKKSQSKSQLPLHPYWGTNRPFVATNAAIPVPEIIPYSTNRFSQCYAQFLEIYAKNISLTEEEKEIGAWWSDDPSEVYSPPGHSYNLGTIAVRTAKANLTVAAETYARVGLGVADAFINCWKAKYKYFSERPSTYVRDNIDGTFVQYWPEPPFPAFISGHATQGAATAIVLGGIYGDVFSFTDNTHERRERDTAQNVDFKPRKFKSFWEAAEESAYSRFLGGIHTRQDNNHGLAVGRQVGNNINVLNWRK